MRAIDLPRRWSNRQALIFVTLCLAAGIAGGWVSRGMLGTPGLSAPAQVAKSTLAGKTVATPDVASQKPDAAQLKRMADAQAASLMQNLKTHPEDPDILIAIGNLYYDAQQYPVAVDFYSRALKSRPSDASVRTDLATAHWYMGNTDQAIEEFNKALTFAPNNPNTLFNLGLVQWQAKHDAAGAIANWKKLLTSNPNYEHKDEVLRMLTEVGKQKS